MRKQRMMVDIDPEIKERAEQMALKLSVKRKHRVSRNKLIAEALESYLKQLEESEKEK